MTRPTILVADDDAAIRSVLAILLGDAGYAVATAVDGEQALLYAAELEPDAILLDQGMPRMNGVEVARALRSRRCAVPILMLSAAYDARRVAESCGADAFLAKPFDIDALLALVARLVDQPVAAASMTATDIAPRFASA
jgi:DNA-binding response OmpR family regulator